MTFYFIFEYYGGNIFIGTTSSYCFASSYFNLKNIQANMHFLQGKYYIPWERLSLRWLGLKKGEVTVSMLKINWKFGILII